MNSKLKYEMEKDIEKKLGAIDVRLTTVELDKEGLVKVDEDEQKQINNLKTMLNGIQAKVNTMS